ncbi:hypothetical protein GJ496_010413 [Pomphorhynchus laevis]|nr:hypothetical protein GJ496_010413 [Pomphorhynchus laevis]
MYRQFICFYHLENIKLPNDDRDGKTLSYSIDVVEELLRLFKISGQLISTSVLLYFYFCQIDKNSKNRITSNSSCIDLYTKKAQCDPNKTRKSLETQTAVQLVDAIFDEITSMLNAKTIEDNGRKISAGKKQLICFDRVLISRKPKSYLIKSLILFNRDTTGYICQRVSKGIS